MILRFLTFILLGFFTFSVTIGFFGVFLPAFGHVQALGQSGFTFDYAYAFFQTIGIEHSLWLSFSAGFITSLLSLFICFLLLAGWYDTRFFKTFRLFLAPLLSIPHGASAIGLAFLLAPSGFFMRALSPWLTGFDRPPDLLILNDPYGLSLMGGLLIKEVPYLLLMCLGALEHIHTRQRLDTMLSLGYGKMIGFMIGVAPTLYQNIRLPLFAVMAYSCSVIDMSIILGPTTPPPLAVRLLEWFYDPDLAKRGLSAFGAIIQLGLLGLLILLWIGLERLIRKLFLLFLQQGWRFKEDFALRFFAAFIAILPIILALLGLVILIIWAFAGLWRFPDFLPQSWTISSLWRLNAQLLPLISTSLLLGMSAALFSMIFVIAFLEFYARKRVNVPEKIIFLFYIPLLIPQISFLFGFQILFLKLHLEASLFALIVTHMLFTLPYCLITLQGAWHNYDQRWAALGASLGYSPRRFLLTLKLPMLMPIVFIAFAISFAVSLSLYVPTIMISSGRITTLTTETIALAFSNDRRMLAYFTAIQAFLPLIIYSLALFTPRLFYRIEGKSL